MLKKQNSKNNLKPSGNKQQFRALAEAELSFQSLDLAQQDKIKKAVVSGVYEDARLPFTVELRAKKDRTGGPYPTPKLEGPFRFFNPGGYVGKKLQDIKRKRLPSFETADTYFRTYVASLVQTIPPFLPILSDFDKQYVLPTTTALGIVKSSHVELEEKGWLGRNNDFEYSEEQLKAVVSDYLKFSKDSVSAEDLKLSMPRGKNIGWPHPIGGMARELNDTLLILHAALVERFQKEKASLSDLTTFLTYYHGQPFTVYGERMQHTDKLMPYFDKQGSVRYSYNFENRVRAIYMSPKFMVMWNRVVVKTVMKAMMQHPCHRQDRAYIKEHVEGWKKKGWIVISLDVSKFDQSFGGKRGRQMLRGLARTACGINKNLREEDVFSDLWFEWQTPLLGFFGDSAFLREDVPILMSGVSTTTPTNLIGNRISQISAMADILGCSSDEAASRYWYPGVSDSGNFNWGALAWGDDGVIALSPSIPGCKTAADALKTLQRSYEKLRLSVDAEPAVKFLGTVYGPGDFRGSIDIGYSVGRFLQLQFFPERPKLEPFSTIGYIARLATLPPALQNEVHKLMITKKGLWGANMGQVFSFAERQVVMDRAVAEVEKGAGNIAELDNILQSLTNGASEFADSFSGEVPSELMKLLGLTRIDLSDLDAALMKDAPDVGHKLKKALTDFRKGNDAQYLTYIDTLRQHFNLSFQAKGLLY